MRSKAKKSKRNEKVKKNCLTKKIWDQGSGIRDLGSRIGKTQNSEHGIKHLLLVTKTVKRCDVKKLFLEAKRINFALKRKLIFLCKTGAPKH
jgi:hypothetical protein